MSTTFPTSQGHDHRGTELFHKLLDAKQALLDAQAAHDAALAALTAHIVWDDGEAQPTISAPVETAPALVETQPEPAPEPKREHHPSFTTAARKSFFARLGQLCDAQGMNKEIAYELSEHVRLRIRPSAMTSAQRRDYLGWLGSLEGIEAYERYAAELELEKRCAEHRVAVEQVMSSPESVRWRSRRAA